MNIRCIIVDDEPLAREGMELLLKEAGFLELKASCSNAMEANKVLTQEEIDLIFLDIQMPKIRGIDFLRSLSNPPLVIITTAYPHFALEGFELNVLDYLVKPITPDRFLRSVNRAREVLEYKQPAAGAPGEDYFFIKCNNGYEKIFYPEILFVEANQNYSTIHTTRAKFMTLTAMRVLEEQLPAGKFLRIQKSYIVSIEKIQSLSGNEITIDKHKIPVSKNYKDELMKIIDRKLIKK
ncbi:MAG TPA: response regulator [Puia sp.]|nr:response regulator [Puia sp.]